MSEDVHPTLDQLLNTFDCSESTRNMARVIYRRAREENLHQGRGIEVVSATALYAAARLENQPYDLGEIATAASVDRTKLGRSYKKLSRTLSLDVQVSNPTEFVPRFSSTLDISDRFSSLAHEIVDIALDTGVVAGCSPSGVAAGAVYFAGRLGHGEDALPQDDVADATQVAKQTIRKRYQDYEDVLGIERLSSHSQPSIYESAGISAQRLNEHLSRFAITDLQPNLLDSQAQCYRCGQNSSYRYLLRNHQPERLDGTQLCYEEGFSAADLARQLTGFEAVEPEVDFENTDLRCTHCGETGPYRKMMHQHHTQQLVWGDHHVCHIGESQEKPTGTEVAEQVDRLETSDAEFEIVEPQPALSDLQIRCIHCGAEGRYGDLARQHQTYQYSHMDTPNCSDRSYG